MSNLLNLFSSSLPLLGFGIAGYFSGVLKTRIHIERNKERIKKNTKDITELKFDVKDIKKQVYFNQAEIKHLNVKVKKLEQKIDTALDYLSDIKYLLRK